MTGKHYNWHRRWIVDLAACTATHDSGLVVSAKRTPDDDGFDFEATNIDAWQDLMAGKMPMPDLVKHAQRLMREAAEVYQKARRENLN